MSNEKKFNTLKLRAIPGAWRLFSARKLDPNFKSFEKKVFMRDQYTCQFCGFKAKEFLDVVNLDGNFNRNKMDNLVTSCCFCSQCYFIESVGVGGYGGGTLIYLPEFTQAEMNSLCHVLFCAITNDTGYKSAAQSIYRGFKYRAQAVEDKFGEGTSDPSSFGHLIIESGITPEQGADKIFDNILLLPSRAKFRKQIECWAATALEEIVTVP